MLIYMLHISDIGQSVNALLRSGDCEGLHSVLQCRLRTFSVNKKKKKVFWAWPRNTVSITVQNWKLLNFSNSFIQFFSLRFWQA